MFLCFFLFCSGNRRYANHELDAHTRCFFFLLFFCCFVGSPRQRPPRRKKQQSIRSRLSLFSRVPTGRVHATRSWHSGLSQAGARREVQPQAARCANIGVSHCSCVLLFASGPCAVSLLVSWFYGIFHRLKGFLRFFYAFLTLIIAGRYVGGTINRWLLWLACYVRHTHTVRFHVPSSSPR